MSQIESELVIVAQLTVFYCPCRERTIQALLNNGAAAWMDPCNDSGPNYVYIYATIGRPLSLLIH